MERFTLKRHYEQELAYQLELMRAASRHSVPDEAARLLCELARGVAAGELTAMEKENGKALVTSLALEVRDSPKLLERFRWANFNEQLRANDLPGVGHSMFEAKLEIVRAACPFLEPYITVTFDQVRARLEELRRRAENHP